MTIQINRHLIGLEAYVPGEQPTEPGWVKLNTNENPYSPAPEVAEVYRSFAPDRARLYPPPNSAVVRKVVGEVLDWPPEGILVTNGSDEGLRLIAHAHLNAGDHVGMLWPTYSFYPLIGAMFGAGGIVSEVGRNGEWPERINLDRVKLFYLSNPNPPYGTFYEPERIAALVAAHRDVLFVIDEAYVDFAGGDCLPVLRRFDNVFITRTGSKSQALAGLRVGFVLARPKQLATLWIVCDSYNVNVMSQLAAAAAWRAGDYYRSRAGKIIETREATAKRLRELGFDVLPSQANFVFARHPEARRLFLQLKERKILVRYFDAPATRDGLRITIGTPQEMDMLTAALAELVGG
jgi:histidinol-phosphate aminotransferase